jgi:hypothetical protein
MLFDQTIRETIAPVAAARLRSAMASASAARIATIAAIGHLRIVLDVAAFLAPAQIKETQLPIAQARSGQIRSDSLNRICRPRESRIFRGALFLISVDGFPEDLLPQL